MVVMKRPTVFRIVTASLFFAFAIMFSYRVVHAATVTHDLANSENYNFKITGVGDYDGLLPQEELGDLDNDGEEDLIISTADFDLGVNDISICLVLSFRKVKI